MINEDFKIYSVDKATSASLWACQCGWELCEKEHSYGPAVRDHYLIHYIASGSGIFKNNNGSFSLTKGQGFVIFPDEMTFYQADEQNPWEYYWVGFKGVDAEHILEKCSISRENPTFTNDNTKKLTDLFAQLLEGFNEIKGREYLTLGYLYLILADVMAQNSAPVILSSNVELYLASALEYVNDNYSYDISISSIATYIGIDRTYLYRIFMDNIKLSPEQYMLKVRMTKAANLLKFTDCSILQAALSCGYKEISHFSNTFKRFFGVSPSIYRK